MPALLHVQLRDLPGDYKGALKEESIVRLDEYTIHETDESEGERTR